LRARPGATPGGPARADEPARLALVFGTAAAELHWADLDRDERAFSQALAQCDETAIAVLGQPVRRALLTGGASDPVTLFAAQVAMTALWHDHGVHPDTVVGLGSGLAAAAHAAGTVDLASAFGMVAGISHEPQGKVPISRVPDQPPAVSRPTLVPPDGAADADLATLAGALATDGVEIVLDACLGPAALALASCRDDLQAMSVAAQGRDAAAEACAQLYAAGVRLDWRRLSGGGQVISLPLHSWQHRSHWIQVPVKAASSPAPAEQDATESARPPSVLAAALRAALADRREEQALDVVLGVVGEVLGETAADISPDRGFFELGMDSVMAIRAKVRLEEAYDIELPDTITFECPNSRELASFVIAEVLRAAAAAAPGTQSQRGRAAAPAPGTDLADHIDELSDADLLDSLDAALVTSQSLLGDEGRQ
jgi:acyl transferase domain-containing protein